MNDIETSSAIKTSPVDIPSSNLSIIQICDSPKFSVSLVFLVTFCYSFVWYSMFYQVWILFPKSSRIPPEPHSSSSTSHSSTLSSLSDDLSTPNYIQFNRLPLIDQLPYFLDQQERRLKNNPNSIIQLGLMDILRKMTRSFEEIWKNQTIIHPDLKILQFYREKLDEILAEIERIQTR